MREGGERVPPLLSMAFLFMLCIKRNATRSALLPSTTVPKRLKKLARYWDHNLSAKSAERAAL